MKHRILIALLVIIFAFTACSPDGNIPGATDDTITTDIPENTVENLPEINTEKEDIRFGESKYDRSRYFGLICEFFGGFIQEDQNIVNFLTNGTATIYEGNNIKIKRNTTFLDVTLFGYGNEYEDNGYIKYYGNVKIDNGLFSKDWIGQGTGGILVVNVIVLDNTFHEGNKNEELCFEIQMSVKLENDAYEIYHATLNGEDLSKEYLIGLGGSYIPENTIENMPHINTVTEDPRLGGSKEERASSLSPVLELLFSMGLTEEENIATIIRFLSDSTKTVYTLNNTTYEKKDSYIDITYDGHTFQWEDGSYLKIYGKECYDFGLFDSNWNLGGSDSEGGLITCNVIVEEGNSSGSPLVYELEMCAYYHNTDGEWQLDVSACNLNGENLETYVL